MSHYVPVFEDIVDSSIWEEPDFVVKVFLTMLAKKKRGGYVWGTAFNLSRWAKKTEEETLKALEILSSPDTRRLEPQKFEGRRIEKVEGGWLILNAEHYQDRMKEENARISNVERQTRFRLKQKTKEEQQPTAATIGSITPEQIYEAYPRKAGRGSALKKIAKAMRKVSPEILMKAVTEFAAAWNGVSDLTFCPFPGTWFGQERYLDSPSSWGPNAQNEDPPYVNPI